MRGGEAVANRYNLMEYPNNNKRYHSLDIVRGLAALSVLFSHWGGWTVGFADGTSKQIIIVLQQAFQFLFWGGGGIHPGVILFIVLSGFCIHFPQALAPNKMSRPAFWWIFALRRSVRIFPVFWVGLLLGVTSIWLMGPEYESKIGYTEGGGQIISLNLIFSIMGVSEVARLFGATALYPGNGPLSTVAVEMILYASYPLFMFVHRRYGLPALMGFGLLVYSTIVWARWLGVEPSYLHGTWFEFVIYWIIGAVSAGVYVNGAIKPKGPFRLLALIVAGGYLCYLLLTTFVHIKGLHVVITIGLALIIGGLLIILLILESKFSQRHNKIAAIMAIFGARSYSLYVVHTPVIFATLWFLITQTSLPEFSYPALTLIMVIITTELMFRFVERPSHYYARQWRQASVNKHRQ